MRRMFWRLLGTLLGIFMRLWFFTVRIKKINEKYAEMRIDGGLKTIFALWHSDLLPLMWIYRNRGIYIPVSLSRDGEIASGLLRSCGYKLIRGSSTRGGFKVLREMEEVLERGGVVAVAVDGPQGPPHQPKRGVIWLSKRCGVEIIPVIAEVKGGIRINSWDRMKVPFPFSIVKVRFGTPLNSPSDVEDGVRLLKKKLEGIEME